MHIGRYTVVEELGVGGMGRVRLARAPDGRPVVLKTALVNDRDDDERLRDEARVGLRLAHPHIVETVDCFEHEGRPVLATVYVAGATILQLRQQGPLPAAAVCRIGRQIADALDTIHECTDEQGKRLGVLHRDVTAGNLIVDADGCARLIDLGIARSRESRAMRTETGMLRGTLRYLAPELFDAGQQSAQSDLWALGVVLWEALVGRPAVTGSDIVAMGRICTGSLMALEPGESSPEPRVQRAIAQLLQRTPQDRPRRARDAAALFAMVQRELGDDGLMAVSGAVVQSLRTTRGGSARDACGLGEESLSSVETAVVAGESPAPVELGLAPQHSLPPTLHDLPSEPLRTPSQGLVAYAARLASMERSLSVVWGHSEKHRREALRGLPVVTGSLVEDHAARTAKLVSPEAILSPPLSPLSMTLALSSLASTAVHPPGSGVFGSAFDDVPFSRIPTPAVRAVPEPGLAQGWLGAWFPSAEPLPPHTPVHLPDAFMRGALGPVEVAPPLIDADEARDVTVPTVSGNPVLAPLPVHVVHESYFASELAVVRRRNAALTLLLVVVVVAFVAYVAVTRLGLRL